MALHDELQATVNTIKGAVPPDTFAAIGASITDLQATGIAARAAGVGAKVGNPTLTALNGEAATLAAATSGAPYVLIFYRGGWCPYCNVTLRAYSKAQRAFEAAGAKIVAVTPEIPSRARSTADAAGVGFPVLVDHHNGFARSLDLVFAVPDDLRPLYRGIGIDLPDWNGDQAHELPVPAVYVVDREGVIRWAHVEADFTTRADPDDVLDAVRGLKG